MKVTQLEIDGDSSHVELRISERNLRQLMEHVEHYGAGAGSGASLSKVRLSNGKRVVAFLVVESDATHYNEEGLVK